MQVDNNGLQPDKVQNSNTLVLDIFIFHLHFPLIAFSIISVYIFVQNQQTTHKKNCRNIFNPVSRFSGIFSHQEIIFNRDTNFAFFYCFKIIKIGVTLKRLVS